MFISAAYQITYKQKQAKHCFVVKNRLKSAIPYLCTTTARFLRFWRPRFLAYHYGFINYSECCLHKFCPPTFINNFLKVWFSKIWRKFHGNRYEKKIGLDSRFLEVWPNFFLCLSEKYFGLYFPKTWPEIYYFTLSFFSEVNISHENQNFSEANHEKFKTFPYYKKSREDTRHITARYL